MLLNTSYLIYQDIPEYCTVIIYLVCNTKVLHYVLLNLYNCLYLYLLYILLHYYYIIFITATTTILLSLLLLVVVLLSLLLLVVQLSLLLLVVQLSLLLLVPLLTLTLQLYYCYYYIDILIYWKCKPSKTNLNMSNWLKFNN